MTGEKALYVNPGFVRRIVGFKSEESEYLLKFLYDHISKGADFQIRARYKPGTVVVWVRVVVFEGGGFLICFQGQPRHGSLGVG